MKSKLIPICQLLLRVSRAVLNFKVMKSESFALITSELPFQIMHFRIKPNCCSYIIYHGFNVL